MAPRIPKWSNCSHGSVRIFDSQIFGEQSTNHIFFSILSYGGTEAATFSCLTTLYKQLNFEDCVDVYMYAKLYHLRRPGIWRCQVRESILIFYKMNFY